MRSEFCFRALLCVISEGVDDIILSYAPVMQLESRGAALVGEQVPLSFQVEAGAAFKNATIDIKVGCPSSVSSVDLHTYLQWNGY